MRAWPTWGCGVSKFPWTYSDTETCYITEGTVVVTPEGGWVEGWGGSTTQRVQ